MIKEKANIHTSDILIIGGGGAAALAALAAREAGATVTLVTKESSLVGGATIMSAGGTSATLSSDDSPEVFLNDIMKAGGQLNNPKLAQMLAKGSAKALLSLEKYNFLLDRKDARTLRTIKQGEGHAFSRGYLDRREALGFCHALSRALLKNGVVVFHEVIATRLFLKDNRAIGTSALSIVTGKYFAFNAKAVILATGGLGALYQMTTNSGLLTGDGYAMAYEAGAELIDMDMVQFLPLAFPYPDMRKGKIIGMCSHFGPGVKLLNGLGERFMEKYDPERMEFATRDVASRAGFTEIREGRGTKNEAVIVDPRDHDPNILERFKTSVPHIHKMFRDVYGDRVAEWQEPFEVTPSQHFFMGGLKIDEECRTTIPGLFAVGEVSGGVHGANRLSGVALTELFVFGPLAGEAAARFVRSEERIPIDIREIDQEKERLEDLLQPGTGIRPFRIKASIQEILWDKLGPVRDGTMIRSAIEALTRIQEKDLAQMVIGSGDPVYNRDRMEAIEVPFMISTALMVATAALMREESRGSHFRTDFPSRNDKEWLRNIVIRKSAGGEMDLYRKDIIRVD